jgi:hypothetical protein
LEAERFDRLGARLRKDVSIAAAEKREAGDRADRSTGFQI